MQVSWTDLNNVQEAGDLPFRDGSITVTFAEIAIWKKNPRATFRLMRKISNEATPKYVLGQQGENGEQANKKSFYTSSSGDTWSLTRDQTTGALLVKHTPNAPSGGDIRHIEIENFLLSGAGGPEHHALRHLIEKTSNATILIAYDIHPAKGATYDDLISAIQSLGAWWHHLETVWIVRSNRTPEEIRDQLKSHVGTDDQLLILDITGDKAGWTGVSDAGSEWLKEYMVDGNVYPRD